MEKIKCSKISELYNKINDLVFKNVDTLLLYLNIYIILEILLI